MSAETPESLAKQAFNYAKKGMVKHLDKLLHEVSTNHTKLLACLNLPTSDPKGLTATPLIIAARSNHTRVVRLLLEKYHVDVEQTGMVEFPGHPVIKGATALWCAASIGDLSMVKMLVEEFNADINHATVTNSTPLRPACFDGFIEVVEYLVKKGASVNTATNYYSNTCLLIASYNGHDKVVNFLLENGAEIEMQDFMGQTALHNAAERGRLNIAKDLVEHGAQFVADEKGLTPLHIACDFNNVEIMNYFLSLPGLFTKEDEIIANELLAASFANGSDNYDLGKCYEYFLKAMEMRYADPEHILLKKVLPPEVVYNNHLESQTIDDLKSLLKREDSLNTEALIAKERIVGKNNVHTLDIIYRGAVLADRKDYKNCVNLWHRALEIRRYNDESISQDLERYGELFSEMIEVHIPPDSKEMLKIFTYTVEELALDLQRAKIKKHDSETTRIEGNINMNINTGLFLASALISDPQASAEVKFDVKKQLYQMIKLKPSPISKTNSKTQGYSLLHLVCDSATEMNEFFSQEFIVCPNYTLVYALLECGADPNIRDDNGNTPLHVLAINCQETPFGDWKEVGHLLLKKGGHIDFKNSEGKIPSDYGTMLEVLAPEMKARSLKCLAAAVIQNFNIDFVGSIPQSLEEFVSQH